MSVFVFGVGRVLKQSGNFSPPSSSAPFGYRDPCVDWITMMKIINNTHRK